MSSSFRLSLAVFSMIVLFFLNASLAAADVYKVTVVDMTQNENFLGIDGNGDFIVNDTVNAFKCGVPNGPSPCFEIFLLRQAPIFSTTAPTLSFDNGTPCTGTNLFPGFLTLGKGVCNNSHDIVGGMFGQILGVWDGPNSQELLLANASFDGGFVNAIGDTVFIDGLQNELIFAQDLTPEPAPLFLFGTGCLVLVAALRFHQRGKM